MKNRLRTIRESFQNSKLDLITIIQQGLEVPDQPLEKRHEYKSETAQYYCPICMFYYDKILKTTCCSQYICRSCILSYCQGKGGLPDTLLQLPSKLPPINCLYCMRTGVGFTVVNISEKIKSYEDSPRVAEFKKAQKLQRELLSKTIDSMDKIKNQIMPLKNKPVHLSSANMDTLSVVSIDRTSPEPSTQETSVSENINELFPAITENSNIPFPLPPLVRCASVSKLVNNHDCINSVRYAYNEGNAAMQPETEGSLPNSIEELPPSGLDNQDFRWDYSTSTTRINYFIE